MEPTDAPDPSDWTAEGAYLVAPGIHRIPLPMPSDGLRAVNVYAIEDGDKLVLIDAGWALEESQAQLSRSLERIGLAIGDITQFLVTHVHRDHYTQAVTIRRELGAHIALGAEEMPAFTAMNDPKWTPTGPQVAQLRRAGAETVIRDLVASGHGDHFDLTMWEQPDEWLKDRTPIPLSGRELTAVATPGHTQGHMVFVSEAEALLFAGDHVLPHITPSIGFEAAPGSLPLGAYLESLALVRAMPDMILLPAHGPVTGSVHERIDELVAHHDRRLADSLAAVQRGAATAYETARLLTWTRRERAFDDLDPFNQMLATCETAAHLDLLVARGVLVESAEDGLSTYSSAAAP
jgi:glyoxylase-like metal-dependent hydrolase (beta-lactamase superfamily II)